MSVCPCARRVRFHAVRPCRTSTNRRASGPAKVASRVGIRRAWPTRQPGSDGPVAPSGVRPEVLPDPLVPSLPPLAEGDGASAMTEASAQPEAVFDVPAPEPPRFGRPRAVDAALPQAHAVAAPAAAEWPLPAQPAAMAAPAVRPEQLVVSPEASTATAPAIPALSPSPAPPVLVDAGVAPFRMPEHARASQAAPSVPAEQPVAQFRDVPQVAEGAVPPTGSAVPPSPRREFAAATAITVRDVPVGQTDAAPAAQRPMVPERPANQPAPVPVDVAMVPAQDLSAVARVPEAVAAAVPEEPPAAPSPAAPHIAQPVAPTASRMAPVIATEDAVPVTLPVAAPSLPASAAPTAEVMARLAAALAPEAPVQGLLVMRPPQGRAMQVVPVTVEPSSPTPLQPMAPVPGTAMRAPTATPVPEQPENAPVSAMPNPPVGAETAPRTPQISQPTLTLPLHLSGAVEMTIVPAEPHPAAALRAVEPAVVRLAPLETRQERLVADQPLMLPTLRQATASPVVIPVGETDAASATLTEPRRTRGERAGRAESARSAEAVAAAPPAFQAHSVAPTEAPSGRPPAREEARQVIEQIIRDVRHQGGDTRQEVTVRLDPPELGVIHLKVTTNAGGEVVAQIETANPQVRDLLDARLTELRRALGDAGVQVGQCSVSLNMQTSGGHGQAGMAHGQPGWPAPQPPLAAPPPTPEPAPEPVYRPIRTPEGAVDYFA